MNNSGIVEIDSKSDGTYSMVPVIQTEINKFNLKLAETKPCYLCKETLGIVFHSFGASDYLLSTYIPHGTAKEYVENGFGTLTSAMFLVGQQEFDPESDLVNLPPSIIQCELPSPSGKLVPSAHVVPVDRENLEKQPFLRSMNKAVYNFGFPYPSSVLQSLYMEGQNSAPNRSMIGIEITGSSFDTPGHFPNSVKLASVLSVAVALTRHYKFSPAFNFLGHRDLDLNKEDPGRRLTYLMKVLVGLYALQHRDKELCESIFKPFINKAPSVLDGINKYFEFITYYFRDSSDKKEADEYLKKN